MDIQNISIEKDDILCISIKNYNKILKNPVSINSHMIGYTALLIYLEIQYMVRSKQEFSIGSESVPYVASNLNVEHWIEDRIWKTERGKGLQLLFDLKLIRYDKKSDTYRVHL